MRGSKNLKRTQVINTGGRWWEWGRDEGRRTRRRRNLGWVLTLLKGQELKTHLCLLKMPSLKAVWHYCLTHKKLKMRTREEGNTSRRDGEASNRVSHSYDDLKLNPHKDENCYRPVTDLNLATPKRLKLAHQLVLRSKQVLLTNYLKKGPHFMVYNPDFFSIVFLLWKISYKTVKLKTLSVI